MGPQRFIEFLFLGVGSLSLLAAMLNWDWLLNAQNARFLVTHLGRTGTRIFYAIMGIAMIFLAFYITKATV